MKKLKPYRYYAVIKHTEHFRKQEAQASVFYISLCSQTPVAFYYNVIQGLGFFICLKTPLSVHFHFC